MRARLLARTGTFRGLTQEIIDDVLVGRSKKCNVVLKSPLVSSQHAKITLDAERQEYFLEDLGSLNGTELDGVPVHGRERLGRLHVIRVSGKFDLIWQGPALCTQLSGEVKPSGTGGYSDQTIEEKLPPTIPAPEPSRSREATDPNRTILDAGPLDLQAILRKANQPDPQGKGDTGDDPSHNPDEKDRESR